jgi:hemolysin activation/secretion protein
MTYRPFGLGLARARSNFAILARISTSSAALGVSVVCASSAYAQAQPQPPQLPPGAQQVIQENERIQRELESRRLQQLQRDRQSTRPPTTIEVPTPDVSANGVDRAVCRNISTIAIEGARLLSRGQQARLTRPYLSRCLTVSDLERLLGEITKAYIDRGRATARAYLPEQDLSTGRMRITVLEGSIGAFQLNGKGVNLGGAFPFQEGKPLNLRSLEQGIDQINRLQSNSATLDIRPGEVPGESIVVVTNQPTRRIYGNVAADNLGSRATGRYQAAVTVTAEAVLGLNELLSFTRRQSDPLNSDTTRSSSETGFAAVPLGPLTFSGGYTASRYRTDLVTDSGLGLRLTGTTKNAYGSIDFAAYRNRTDQLHLLATLTYKDNRSFIDGQLLTVSSRKLAVLDLDASFTTTRLPGLLTFGAGYSRGLKAFNALRDLPDLPGDAPRAQFDKFRVSAAYFNSLGLGRQRIDLSSVFAAQFTGDTLFGSEQFAVGGVYSVRGFRETTLANDKGFYLRNEISAPMQVGSAFQQPVTLKPYIGLDVGRATGNSEGTPSGTLLGAALGSSLTVGPAFFDLFVARRLDGPRFLDREGFQLFGRLSVRI